MKRLFIHFSNLFILIFLLWIAFISPNTVIHRSLPVIGILQQEREVVYEELSSSLDQLAKENNVTGSRIMGGGFGGCTINLVKEELYDAFVANASEKYEAKYGRKPGVYNVVIGDGSRKIC